MKVLVDPEIFFHGRCGMVRYYSFLFKQLQQRGIELDIPLLISGSDFIEGQSSGLTKIQAKLTSPRIAIRYKARVDRLSKKKYFQKLENGDYDVVFITSSLFEDTFLSYLPPNKPVVMVVHDTMRVVLAPDGLHDPAGPNADRLAYLINKVTSVIAISQCTKNDILKLTSVDDEQVKVIYTGNLLEIDKKVDANFELPKSFLLFVGERTGRKNFRYFIQAISQWMKEQPDLYMICTGKTNKWEQDLFERIGIQDRVLFMDAPDDVLIYLYQHAKGLIFPSLYEGFGLPVLEAMSLGCPVVTTKYGSLEEVGGDGVIYVDPYDAASILQGVRTLIEDEEFIELLKNRGLQQAQKFTLEKMVQQFCDELYMLRDKYSLETTTTMN